MIPGCRFKVLRVDRHQGGNYKVILEEIHLKMHLGRECSNCEDTAAESCDYGLCGACCLRRDCICHGQDECRRCENLAAETCDYGLCGTCCLRRDCGRHGQ